MSNEKSKITLSNFQVLQASNLGTMRFTKADQSKTSITKEINLAAAEIVLAKVLDRFLDGSLVCKIFNFRNRNYRARHDIFLNSKLTIYPTDEDLERIVFIVGNIPSLTIAGWITVKEAKVIRFYDQESKCWIVPQTELCRDWQEMV